MSRLKLLEKSIASIRRQLPMKCLSGSLISCINDHGPITRENVSSAAKRLRGPLNNCLPHTDGDKDLMLIRQFRHNQLIVAEKYLKAQSNGEPCDQLLALYYQLEEKAKQMELEIIEE